MCQLLAQVSCLSSVCCQLHGVLVSVALIMALQQWLLSGKKEVKTPFLPEPKDEIDLSPIAKVDKIVQKCKRRENKGQLHQV